MSANFMTSCTQNIFHDDIYLATPTFKLQNEGPNIKIWWVVQILWLFFQIKCFQGKFADRAWKKCWRQQNYDVTTFFIRNVEFKSCSIYWPSFKSIGSFLWNLVFVGQFCPPPCGICPAKYPMWNRVKVSTFQPWFLI